MWGGGIKIYHEFHAKKHCTKTLPRSYDTSWVTEWRPDCRNSYSNNSQKFTFKGPGLSWNNSRKLAEEIESTRIIMGTGTSDP